MKIGIDVDGVICDLHSALQQEYHNRTGRSLFFPTWEMLHTDDGSPANRAEVDNIFCSLGFWSDLPYYKGAFSCVRGLVEAGHDVFFHTIPPPMDCTFYNERKLWFKKHGLGDIPICFVPNKRYVSADAFIDDRAQNIEDFLDGPSRYTFSHIMLCKRPWSYDGYNQKVGLQEFEGSLEQFVEKVKEERFWKSLSATGS